MMLWKKSLTLNSEFRVCVFLSQIEAEKKLKSTGFGMIFLTDSKELLSINGKKEKKSA
jgi:hypothetical protein